VVELTPRRGKIAMTGLKIGDTSGKGVRATFNNQSGDGQLILFCPISQNVSHKASKPFRATVLILDPMEMVAEKTRHNGGFAPLKLPREAMGQKRLSQIGIANRDAL